MPFFLGYPTTSNKKLSESLVAQNIPLLRAAPNSFKASGLPRLPSLIYSSVVSWVTYFCVALATKTTNTAQEWGRTIPLLPSSARLPFKYPGLAIRLTQSSEAVVQELLSRGFHHIDLKRTSQYLKSEPTLDDINYVRKNVKFDQTGFVPYGYANMSAVLASIRLSSMATALAHMFSAPAYLYKHDFELAKTGGKRKRASDGMEVDEQVNGYLPSMTEKTTAWQMMSTFFEPTSDNSTLGSIEGTRMKDLSANSIVFDPESVLFDSPDGIFVPYVRDLALRDKVGPMAFIDHYMVNSFGNDPEEIAENLENFRAAWGILSKTEVGYQFAHLFKCYEIAIGAQAGVRVVIERGYYNGVVLVGADFNIITGSTVVRPLAPSALRADLQTVPTHSVALRQISTILSRYVAGASVEQVTSMGVLRTLLMQFALTETDRNTITKLAFSLRFSQPWAVNPQTIESFCSAYTSSGSSIDDSVPITANALFEVNKLYALLTAFGKVIPSPVIPGGRALDLRLERPAPKTEPIVGRKSGQKRVIENSVDEFEQTVQFRLVSFASACNDWDEVVRDGKIYVLPGQTARNSMIRVFRGAFAAKMWDVLKGMPMTTTEPVEGAAQRQRAEREAKGEAIAKDTFWGGEGDLA